MDKNMSDQSRIKDSLNCPYCKKEIINKERQIVHYCPFCGDHLFSVLWLEKDLLIEMSNKMGLDDKAQLISEKLKEHSDTPKQDEILKKKIDVPWWKKMF